MPKEQLYKVKGMHCASCEILIEKKMLELEGVKAADASTHKGEVIIEYEGEKPDEKKLNTIFSKEGYSFSENEISKKEEKKNTMSPTLFAFDIALFIIIAFLFLDRAGISGLSGVSSGSSIPAFFIFGLLAGISSCAALVGGIVLSMSKQWLEIYSENQKFSKKIQPHVMFNAGRVASYALFGGLLGLVGSKLQFSLQASSFLIIAISFLMVAMGLQMLGVKAFRKFQIAPPKFITRNIADERNFQGKLMPLIMGALTFFLPCGFTITAQGIALLSGSFVKGSLIMSAFALGTVPMLMLIGLSSAKFSSKPHLAERFSKIAGFLVLFFALFNINGQLNVLGFSGINSLFGSGESAKVENLPPMVEGKQIIKMEASASGYSPNYFKVRANVPVRWEITDIGTSGCTNAVISRNLFDGQVDLEPGKLSVKEFTPATPGKYRFSCWMGMVSGTIEVIDENSGNAGNDSSSNEANSNPGNVASASASNSCGGSCGGSCGCGGKKPSGSGQGASCH